MSLFARRGLGDTANQLIPSRVSGRTTGLVQVTADTAMRTSAVWAALRLRADLVSTMPIDVYRRVQGIQVEVPKPPVLVNPGGEKVGIQEWLYSSQIELDRIGNVFGHITARDGMGKPARIDLVESTRVTVRNDPRSGELSYKFYGENIPAADVWHERQFTVPGLALGLSPVAYAAYGALSQYLSAVEFGLEWFTNGGTVPSGHFRNTKKELQPDEARVVKDRFKSAVADRDVMVTGNDWEYSPITTIANEAQFLETQNSSAADIARFFGVPHDLIDITSMNKSSITYANVQQRNLQFLIMNLGPVFARREVALSNLVANPRFVKFNTDALLRMDPATRTAMFAQQIQSKQRTPNETRALDNMPPYTDAQITELEDLGIVTESVEPVADSPIMAGEE